MTAIPIKGILYDMNTMMNGQGPTDYGRRQPCADFELNAAECAEAYGIRNSHQKCLRFIEDAQECKTKDLRKVRSYLMSVERYKKVLKAEIPWSERQSKKYDADSHVEGTFYP